MKRTLLTTMLVCSVLLGNLNASKQEAEARSVSYINCTCSTSMWTTRGWYTFNTSYYTNGSDCFSYLQPARGEFYVGTMFVYDAAGYLVDMVNISNPGQIWCNVV